VDFALPSHLLFPTGRFPLRFFFMEKEMFLLFMNAVLYFVEPMPRQRRCGSAHILPRKRIAAGDFQNNTKLKQSQIKRRG